MLDTSFCHWHGEIFLAFVAGSDISVEEKFLVLIFFLFSLFIYYFYSILVTHEIFSFGPLPVVRILM